MNNTSQIAPTKLTLWSINFSAPEGNGSILILQTILTGTTTRCATAASELRPAVGAPARPEPRDAAPHPHRRGAARGALLPCGPPKNPLKTRSTGITVTGAPD